MNIGKSVRLERIFNRNTGRSIIVPLDHGTTVGPIAGLVDLRETVNKVAEGGANAVLMHKGLPRCAHRGHGRDVGLIIHLSASTTLSPFPNAKILVGSVEDGIKLGADAVSVHLNLGDESERDMLRDLGALRQEGEAARADAELVLRAYEVWGEDCLRHIEGDFALIRKRSKALIQTDARSTNMPLFQA